MNAEAVVGLMFVAVIVAVIVALTAAVVHRDRRAGERARRRFEALARAPGVSPRP